MKIDEKIALLLLRAKKIDEFDGCRIFFLKEKEFKELLKIRDDEVKRMEEEGISRKKALKEIAKHFKIINPSDKPIKPIKYIYNRTYSLSKKKEKIVKEEILKDFYIWKNKELKAIKKYVKENGLSEAEANKFTQKIHEKIRQTEILVNDIIENPDRYDLMKTNLLFAKKVYYPYLFYYDFEKEKTQKEYLKQDVPNIVFETDKLPQRKPRPTKVDKELSQMRHLFSYIYYKKKD